MMEIILSILFSPFIMFFIKTKSKISTLFYCLCLMLCLFLIIFMDNMYSIYIINKFLFLNQFSFMFIILSLLIISFMFLSLNNNEFNWNQLIIMFILLLIFILMCFSISYFVLYYFFFEASMFPIMLMIINWGKKSYLRIESSLYMFLYTFISSLSMFYLILYFMEMGMMKFYMINLMYYFNSISFMFLILGLLTKMPLYMFHFWLPKAHVWAPVYGSMVLAGIMLKLGGYGLMWMIFMGNNSLNFNSTSMILMFSLFGGMYMSVICLYQIDMKSIVAYSSVVHMSMVISSLMTFSMTGIMGAHIMMIGHGIISSGLFYLVNLNYERTNSRLIILNKGMMNLLPSMSLWWFLLSMSNISMPFSLNFMGEIMMIYSLMNWSIYTIFIILPIMFFSSCYMIMLYNIQHGWTNKNLFYFTYNKVKEFIIVIMHWFLGNMSFMFIDKIIDF
nr:NADH dehydrogenase subunit 4 [Megacampsomeris sp. 1 YJY-2023a]